MEQTERSKQGIEPMVLLVAESAHAHAVPAAFERGACCPCRRILLGRQAGVAAVPVSVQAAFGAGVEILGENGTLRHVSPAEYAI